MKTDVRTLVTLALLVALVAILAATPLGYLNLGIISVTIMCLPVIIGTISLGLWPGIVLGLAFGLTSFVMALQRPSVLLAFIIQNDGLWTLLPSIFAARLLIPVVTHYVARALTRAPRPVCYGAAAAAGSLTNTVFFLGLMYLMHVAGAITGFPDGQQALPLLLGIAGGNGITEAAAAAIVCPPILLALEKTRRGAKAGSAA